MSNIIGEMKKSKRDYSYFSLLPFPSKDLANTISSEIIQRANKAQFLLGKLSGIALLIPNVEYFISSYIMKDAASSSQIEGTIATMVEAMEFIADPVTNKNSDADDIAHYIKALNYGLKRLKEEDFPLSLRFITELHSQLMLEARASHFSDPGEFRKTQNWIGGTRPGNASYVPPSPENMLQPLSDLEEFIHTPFIHPVIDAGLLHAQFETIHPFLDGNGRTGRLLITFYLIHHRCLDLPALFLSSYFEKFQKKYYEKLDSYHFGEVNVWLGFFIDAVIDTAESAIDISKKITALRDRDLERISKLSSRTSEIAEIVIKNLYKDPIASTTTIQSWVKQSKPGTLNFIAKMVEIGILTLHKKSKGVRPALYSHKEYIDIFTES